MAGIGLGDSDGIWLCAAILDAATAKNATRQNAIAGKAHAFGIKEAGTE